MKNWILTFSLFFSSILLAEQNQLSSLIQNPSSVSSSSYSTLDAVFFELWVAKISQLNIEEFDTLQTNFESIKNAFILRDKEQRARGQLALFDSLLLHLNEATKVKSFLEIKDIQNKILLIEFGRSILLKDYPRLDKIPLTKDQQSALETFNTFNLIEMLASAIPLLLSPEYEQKADNYIQSKQDPELLKQIRSGYISK